MRLYINDVAVRDGFQIEPHFVPTDTKVELIDHLSRTGLHKIEVWTARYGIAIADWPDQPIDPFFNVNTPEDAERARRIALQHS